MDALARREHSFAELKRKLQQKFSEQLAFPSLRERAVPDVRPGDAQPSSLDTLTTGFSSEVHHEWNSESNSESKAETSSEPNLDPNSGRTRQAPESKFSEAAEGSEAAGLTQQLSSETAISEEGLCELINEQLSRLRDEGLQSDARFTESFVRYRKTRGFAYQHIRADLLGRGVRGDLIEESLLIDDPDWADMAEALVTKKLLGVSDRQFGGKTHRKLVRFLESRGYPRAIIRGVLDSKFSQSSRRPT
jgi:regulatory protein